MTNTYASVTAQSQHKKTDSYYLHDVAADKISKNDELNLLQNVSSLKMTDFMFEERNYLVKAKNMDLTYCKGKKSTLLIKAPVCETLRLKVWSLQILYTIDW